MRPRVYPTVRCAQSPLSNVQTVQSFFCGLRLFACCSATRVVVGVSPPTISKSAPWCDWRLDRIWGKTKPRNYPVMVESISDWHHISIPQSITDYGSRVLKRCQITVGRIGNKLPKCTHRLRQCSSVLFVPASILVRHSHLRSATEIMAEL